MAKETAIEKITERMRKFGLKITPARVKVVSVLAKAKKPLSADGVYEKMKDSVDRVTVYRTLSSLAESGCVSRFTFQNKHVYELATTHSHYLVCKSCDTIERITSCAIHGIENMSLKSSRKFASVDNHSLHLPGVCKECSH